MSAAADFETLSVEEQTARLQRLGQQALDGWTGGWRILRLIKYRENAVFEGIVYDDEGNLLTGTLMDYAMPAASELPSFEAVNTETPTHLNPLGAKGIGESGTIGATPSVQSAVIDALAHLGVRHLDMPLSPQRVWAAIRDAEG